MMARLKTDGVGGLDPFAGRQRKAVQTGLVSKGLEFETFEIRVVDLLPDTNEFKGIAIPHPTVNQDVFAKSFRHVGEADEILTVLIQHGNGRASWFQLGDATRVANSNPLEFEGIRIQPNLPACRLIMANS